jgi:hypothetical protein
MEEAKMEQQAAPSQEPITDGFVVVPPSPVVQVIIRPMTRVLNPVMAKFAGKRYFPLAAQVHHVGRRSGRQYVATVGARLVGAGVLVPLTFGNQSDWARNVRAAGGGWLRLQGEDYEVTLPSFIGSADAEPLVRSGFNRLMRSGFKFLGIKQFMFLRLVEST